MPNTSEKPLRIPSTIRIGIAEPCFAHSGEKGNWKLNFSLSQDVEPNKELIFYAHGGRNVKGTWSNLQIDQPSEVGYVTLKTQKGLQLEACSISEDRGMVHFKAPNVGVKKGEVLVLSLGSKQGAVAPISSLPNKIFLLMTQEPSKTLESEGKAPYGNVLNEETSDQIVGVVLLDIKGAKIDHLRAIAPSTVIIGKSFSILIRPEDKYNNVSYQTINQLVLKNDSSQIPIEITKISNSSCILVKNVIISKMGICRLKIENNSNALNTTTNPIKCLGTNSKKLLWGMIHAHTEISDGAGSLDHYFCYMRDECALDFGATSDHDHTWETPKSFWKISQDKTAEYNQPGTFTTFLGYEWAKWRQNGDGDRNVYYFHDHRPMYRSGDGFYPRPDNLFKALKGEKAIVIPHHPAEYGNFCDYKDHDIEKERLIEIYSRWGCSEKMFNHENPYKIPHEYEPGMVQRALEMGWFVGFTAGGDDHTGHPGDESIVPDGAVRHKAGLMAVWADSNCKEDIWNAMWNRRCYGTTGARIILSLNINDNPMGSILDAKENAEYKKIRSIKIEVCGTNLIKSIDIIRNNKDIYSYKPEKLDVIFEYQDTVPLEVINLPKTKFCKTPFTFYYIRITQTDKEMAWSSPIWIIS